MWYFDTLWRSLEVLSVKKTKWQIEMVYNELYHSIGRWQWCFVGRDDMRTEVCGLPSICPPTQPARPSWVLGAVQGCVWDWASWRLIVAQSTISTCRWTPPTAGNGQSKVPWSINHKYHTLATAMLDDEWRCTHCKTNFIWNIMFSLVKGKVVNKKKI